MRHLLLLSLISLGACAGANDIFRSTPTYYPTAEQNYQHGLKELKGGNYVGAQQYFQHVKTTFGFSKWATLAELGVADCDVGRERYIEAIDEYKQFSKAHPFHERVTDGYIAFKIGEAFYKQIPSDWFLSPPAYEKDQGPVLDALRELEAFSDQFADSPYAKKAEGLKGDCVRRLADHELYLADFYLKVDRPQAAIGRLEGVLRSYPGAKREPETLLLLGKTYLKMEKPSEARAVFVRLADEHPNDFRAEKARRFLQFIDKRYPHKNYELISVMEDRLRRQMQLAYEYYENGEYERAEPMLVEVLGQHRGFADLFNMLGVIYHDRGQFQKAEAMFEEALQVNPSYTEAALNLSITYNDRGKYREAREIYSRALANSQAAPRQLDPFAKGKIANMHARTADAYAGLGLHNEAVAEYRKALDLCPTFVDIRSKLAATLRDLGDREAAIREYQQVKTTAPLYIPARIQLGITLHSIGRNEEARAEWEAVLKEDPENKSCRLYLDLLA